MGKYAAGKGNDKKEDCLLCGAGVCRVSQSLMYSTAGKYLTIIEWCCHEIRIEKNSVEIGFFCKRDLGIQKAYSLLVRQRHKRTLSSARCRCV